ncbi:MAG: glycerophosphodiester phosphodiesterase, partial [Candidatus Thorarchaeota archaeon]
RAVNIVVRVIGHRGLGKGPLENTVEGVRKAIDLGVDGIEIDVLGSRDGAVVVFHDFMVDEKTNGKGAVSGLTLEELQRLDLGNGLKIPTLKELIELVQSIAELCVMIEIKSENIEELVLDEIYDGKIVEQVIISSYHYSVLEKIRDLDKIIPTGLIFKQPLVDPFRLARSLGCSILAPQFQLISPNFVKKSRQVGLDIYPWAVNEKEDVEKMIAMGLEVLITDEVQRVQQLLNSLPK